MIELESKTGTGLTVECAAGGRAVGVRLPGPRQTQKDVVDFYHEIDTMGTRLWRKMVHLKK